jgi:hydroxyacylglutathione hydrolase
MTHSGTMTYLLGRGEVVVIDPGPADPRHLAAILAVLEPGERIVAVLLTHAHADHVAGLPALQAATGAPSFGFGPAGAGRSARMLALSGQVLPGPAEGFDPTYAPDHRLIDGQILTPAGFAVTALHTPGHTGCSLSFAVGDWLFTGDLAMGWASSLVSPPDGDMGDYMASLDRLQQRRWSHLFPGHGAPVTAPAARLAALVAHRRDREAQVLAALTLGPQGIPALTAAVYRDTPPALIPAARRNVLAHLIDLTARGRVAADPAPRPDARFTLI